MICQRIKTVSSCYLFHIGNGIAQMLELLMLFGLRLYCFGLLKLFSFAKVFKVQAEGQTELVCIEF
jgi:hypothetical protein